MTKPTSSTNRYGPKTVRAAEESVRHGRGDEHVRVELVVAVVNLDQQPEGIDVAAEPGEKSSSGSLSPIRHAVNRRLPSVRR